MQNAATFLTIAQAAQFLNVSPDTLRRWERRGIVTPQRTKGGTRRYTLLDLKIAKLNKRKTSVFHIPTLVNLRYLSNSRDLKVAAFTSFLWVFGILIYYLLTPVFLMPTNPEQNVLSDQLKAQNHLKIASETSPVKTIAANTLGITDKTPVPDEYSSTGYKVISEVSSGSDLLIGKFSSIPAIRYADNLSKYYSLDPLPQSQIPSLIKRI